MSKRKVSKLLVIDASVARAAGSEGATNPTAANCREFLKQALAICHRLAWTQEISDEWRRHQSNFTRKWRVAMVSRKKVVQIDTGSLGKTEDSILQLATSAKGREIIEKDLPLVAAALASDKTIISLDDEARNQFEMIAARSGPLRRIAWVNPDGPTDTDVDRWLKSGAKPTQTIMLGASHAEDES